MVKEIRFHTLTASFRDFRKERCIGQQKSLDDVPRQDLDGLRYPIRHRSPQLTKRARSLIGTYHLQTRNVFYYNPRWSSPLFYGPCIE